MTHAFPCGCGLCGSFVIDGGAGSDKARTTVDEVARLLSDVATLAKMDRQLRERVEVMLRDITRGRR